MRKNLPLPTDVEPQKLLFSEAGEQQHRHFHQGKTKNNSKVPLPRDADFTNSRNLKDFHLTDNYVTAPRLLPIQTVLDTHTINRAIHGDWKGDSFVRDPPKGTSSSILVDSKKGKILHGWSKSLQSQLDYYTPWLVALPQNSLVDFQWKDTGLYAKEIGNSIQFDPKKTINMNPLTIQVPIEQKYSKTLLEHLSFLFLPCAGFLLLAYLIYKRV